MYVYTKIIKNKTIYVIYYESIYYFISKICAKQHRTCVARGCCRTNRLIGLRALVYTNRTDMTKCRQDNI